MKESSLLQCSHSLSLSLSLYIMHLHFDEIQYPMFNNSWNGAITATNKNKHCRQLDVNNDNLFYQQ